VRTKPFGALLLFAPALSTEITFATTVPGGRAFE
jgi:hypothetical protein